ncbi:MAG: hypothetical protein U9N14_03550 [Pseudomonadota bacterium]|nr:hypothetical protein [Pseudomonadota bacterium]
MRLTKIEKARNLPIPEGMLGYRDIKGLLYELVRQFTDACCHYAWVAHHHREPVVRIDLLSAAIHPPLFDFERNQCLARQCYGNLQTQAKKLAPPRRIISAELIAEFNIDDFRQEEKVMDRIGPSIITVILVDDRGHEWRNSHTEPYIFLDPPNR